MRLLFWSTLFSPLAFWGAVLCLWPWFQVVEFDEAILMWLQVILCTLILVIVHAVITTAHDFAEHRHLQVISSALVYITMLVGSLLFWVVGASELLNTEFAGWNALFLIAVLVLSHTPFMLTAHQFSKWHRAREH